MGPYDAGVALNQLLRYFQGLYYIDRYTFLRIIIITHQE